MKKVFKYLITYIIFESVFIYVCRLILINCITTIR